MGLNENFTVRAKCPVDYKQSKTAKKGDFEACDRILQIRLVFGRNGVNYEFHR